MLLPAPSGRRCHGLAGPDRQTNVVQCGLAAGRVAKGDPFEAEGVGQRQRRERRLLGGGRGGDPSRTCPPRPRRGRSRGLVLHLVDEEQHLVERGEQAERRGENEPDGRERGIAAADQARGPDDEHRADDECRFEDVAEAAVDHGEPPSLC